MADLDAPLRTGWFGKLPGSGDFAQRRLDPAFTHTWDGWLHDGMAQLRHRHADWLSHYLQAPVWQFMLGQQLVAAHAWLGVMMPSVWIRSIQARRRGRPSVSTSSS